MPPCFATRIFYGAGFFVDGMEWLMYSTRDIKYLGKKNNQQGLIVSRLET